MKTGLFPTGDIEEHASFGEQAWSEKAWRRICVCKGILVNIAGSPK
jgi:hypothetical protein